MYKAYKRKSFLLLVLYGKNFTTLAAIIYLLTQSQFVWYKFRRSPYHILLKRVDREFTRYQWKLILAPDVNDLDHVTLSNKLKKGNSSDNILFSLLASLFAHQSCQSLYIALRGCNRKNFHRLIFCERKFLISGWKRTPIFELAYLCPLWPTKRSGMWPREFTFLIWQTHSVVQCSLLEAWAWNSRYSSCTCRGFIFHSHCKGLQKISFRSSKKTTCR